MTDLTIACISKVEAFSPPFLLAMQELSRRLDCEFVIGADGPTASRRAHAQFHRARIVDLKSEGWLESVHDDLMKTCTTAYILRLDDDEKASSAMIEWLMDRAYRARDHWKFSRANLWTKHTFISASPLWPDHQTRLSAKAKMMGRNAIHAGSPFGGGCLAPVAIEHYKFVVKTRAERIKIAENYDKVQDGLGTGGMKVFNLPEDVYEEIPVLPWNGSIETEEVWR